MRARDRTVRLEIQTGQPCPAEHLQQVFSLDP